MVNTGHPSRACDPCKARHTKCDERRPCFRCKRAGRDCTGSDDDFDIRFRDETHGVVRRTRARMSQSQSIQQHLSVPYEQQAVGLFIENFVLNLPGSTYSKGFLAGLLPSLRTTESNSLLSSTVDAVSLCFFSCQVVDKSIASRATSKYLRALRSLQASLYHDSDGISAETMISVFLMGLYEMMVPPKETLHPWLAHLQGLTTIMKARSRASSLTSFSNGSSSATGSSLDESARATDHDTPAARIPHDEGTTHSDQDRGHAPDTSPFTNWWSMQASLEDLMAWTQPVLQTAPSVLASRHHGAQEDVVCLLTTARSQLSSLKSWALRIPNPCQPRTINHQIPQSEISRLDIYPGRLDVYPDLHVAALWNTQRTTLLRLCDVITQCGQYLENDNTAPFEETEEYRKLRVMATETSEKICASVAYHINNDWINRITGICSNQGSSPRALGGLCLMWPLYAGSVLSIVPDTHRMWMRRKLRSIGVEMGIAQAVVLADTVDLGRRTDPFKTLVIAQGERFMRSASML